MILAALAFLRISGVCTRAAENIDGGVQAQTSLIQSDTLSNIRHEACLTPGELENMDLLSCTSEWGAFSPNGSLLSTQLNYDHNPPKNFTGFWDTANVQRLPGIGLFVFFEQQFAICLIPKVGSSMWSDVLLKMFTHDMSTTGKNDWETQSLQMKGSISERTQVFSNPSAQRVVFVREPLSRFASAVLDKCVSEASLSMCPMLEAVKPGKSLTMRTAVEWMLNADLTTINVHWMPQSFFCELRDRVSEYTVVGLYSEEQFGHDSACVMRIGGLGDYNTKGQAYNNTPFWGEYDVSSGKAPNGFHVNDTLSEHRLLQKLFEPNAARDLIWKLRDDYVTFHFPEEPAWLAGATGSLYDEVFY